MFWASGFAGWGAALSACWVLGAEVSTCPSAGKSAKLLLFGVANS